MSEIYVSSGVTSTGVIVWSYDTMHVLSAGTANSTTVNNGGDLEVSCGGVANSTTVNASGDMGIEYGGVNNDGCDDILINSNGNWAPGISPASSKAPRESRTSLRRDRGHQRLGNHRMCRL